MEYILREQLVSRLNEAEEKLAKLGVLPMRQVAVKLGYAALRAGYRFKVPSFVRRLSEQGYLADLLKRLRAEAFIDVGANCGIYAKHIRMAGFDGEIFSFEPSSEDFAALQRLSAGDSKWQVFNFAIGAARECRQFNVIGSGVNVWSSFLSPTSSELSVARTERVEIHRLDSIHELRRFSRLFVKADTQGFDLEVIRGAEGLLPRVVGLLAEISVIPIYRDSPHYTAALNIYRDLGFTVMKLFEVDTEPNGAIREYDCLMARPEFL
jgi:FkbM family methyltransferase